MHRSSLSTIIVAYQSRNSIEACLRSLERQSVAVTETILVDSGTDGTGQLAQDLFPWVKVIRSHERLYPGAARNLALRHAMGNVIAFLDSDCEAAEDWVERTLAAHDEDKAHGQRSVVGGSVDNAFPESRIAWASYFCEMSQWMPCQPPSMMPDVPTCSLSAPREVFSECGPFHETGYCSDTAFNWKVAAQGGTVRFDPAIRIVHRGHTRATPWLRKWLRHGRYFASVRVKDKGLTVASTLLLFCSMPSLPAILTWRTARRVYRGHQRMLPFLSCLPEVLVGHCAWSLGEAIGYFNALRATR